MASDKQKELFEKLLSEKQFPPTMSDGSPFNADTLRAKFAELDTGSGSEWIEKALALPDKGSTPPPF